LSGGRRPGVPVVVVPLVLRRHGGEKKEVWKRGWTVVQRLYDRCGRDGCWCV
jgi:hypothetical protein